MKNFKIETEWISKKGLSGNMLLTYALIQASELPMTNTEVANSLVVLAEEVHQISCFSEILIIFLQRQKSAAT